ncbi:hypothetical protein SERLA73DRAFT_167340 [Serpula lacrymans var. lacrymans S7.3]|uniref:Clp1-like protein n=2 Tax=Serpula lacrymans var. lacrymans TaxID=341189 RepID=F8PRX7_SERL3|nr:uncharacterized protein SERLADRAFT_447979 [Serpula lacrymans var. lacrymans S7.9]EGO01212.1 hypothetical protein SERLA73DRAFT_167340 [Serpula lacrymans var. lacrymans S7.3]EGO26861.1 hypothetical protein SERLADRAFT_447979 [Serpula lacrymans var. lacrymans S7.9]
MATASPSQNVQLPRTLQRPPYAEVSRDNIAALEPDLAGVPLEYVRRGLRVKANQMLAGISALSPSHLPSTLPRSHMSHTRSLTIPIRPSSLHPSSPSSPSFPTHILALTPASKSQAAYDAPATLVATHSLILAAHCASLPRLPHSTPPSSPGTVSITIPVLPLSIPAPQAFAPLHSFMYTHSTATLMSALLPACPSSFLSSLSTSSASARGTLSSGPALHTLSSHLLSHVPGGQHNAMSALAGVAQHVAAVWRNAVALGIHDHELWDCLDLAWEVVLGAMNLGAGIN